MSSLHFTSLDPVKRRLGILADSKSPGFNAVIWAVHLDTKTVDVKVTGGAFIIVNVKYSTSFRNPPEYIREGQAVFVRHSRGSKFNFEVEGPGFSVPLPVDGTNTFPDPPPSRDAVLVGLEVVECAVPGSRVAVKTGQARFNDVILDFNVVKLGENLTPKVSGAVPGIATLGELAKVGSTYLYVPLPAAPASGSGNERIDMLELGSDGIIYFTQGTAAPDPVPPTRTAGRVLLAYIYRNEGQSAVFNQHINASGETDLNLDLVILTAIAERPLMDWNDATNNTITVQSWDFTGAPLSLVDVELAFDYGTGAISPISGTTSAAGVFESQYTRENLATDKSPQIKVIHTDSDTNTVVGITLLDSSGQPML